MGRIGKATKSLVAYGLLVVPPFVGLLVVLNLGNDITPPRSIGGTWVLDANAAPTRCAAPAARLHIQQSGPRAEIRFGDDPRDAISVRLEDATVRTRARGRATGDACGALVVDAQVTGRDSMEGTIRRDACPDCSPIAFRAVRERVPKHPSH